MTQQRTMVSVARSWLVALGVGLCMACEVQGPAEGAPEIAPDRLVFYTIRDSFGVMAPDGTERRLFRPSASIDRVSSPAISPDRRHIAFEGYRNNQWDLYVANADGTGPVQLTSDTAQDLRPRWSPDGRWIAFHSSTRDSSTIVLIRPNGTERRPLLSDGWGVSWSPNGARLAFTGVGARPRRIFAVGTDGTNLQQLSPNPCGSNCDGDILPAWAPDDVRIAFVRLLIGSQEVLAVMQADGSNSAFLTQPASAISMPVWSPDGQRLAFTSCEAGRCEIIVISATGSDATGLTSGADFWEVVSDWTR